MISFLHRFFTTHIKREKAPSWISKNKGNNISTSTQEAHTQPSNKKKSKQKNLKSKKEKKQHGTNPTIQPSNHLPHTENSPFISHLILLQNSPRPSLWCLSLGEDPAVNIPSRSTDDEDPQQGFPRGAKIQRWKPLKLDLSHWDASRILRLYIQREMLVYMLGTLPRVRNFSIWCIYIYIHSNYIYRLHIHMVCL